MRTKVTLVLLFLNVALFFYIYKVELPTRGAGSGPTGRDGLVLGAEAADIRSLVVTSTVASGSFTLERRRDAWFLTKPFEWPANLHAAQAIVHDLQRLKSESTFDVAKLGDTGLSLADYGLDKPKIVVALSSVDPAAGVARTTAELRLGDTTKDGKRLYVLSPDGARVHVVARSLADSLTLPIDQLRSDALLAVRVFEAKTLSIQTAGNAGVRVRIRRDGARWKFETPLIATASKTAVEVAVGELNALRAKSFPATPPATLPSAAPTLRVTLEGNGVNETLFVGDPVPVPASAAGPSPAPAAEFYAQLEGRPAVFTVTLPTDLLRRLGAAQETLREKRILDFDPAQVTAIEITSPAQPRQWPVTLQRLEAPPGQAADVTPAWQLVVRGDNAQGPQTLPAERAAVARLLERLSLLAAEKFQSDAPTSADLEDWGFNLPLRVVTLTLAGNAAPLVLRLGTDSNRTLMFARAGTPGDAGNSIYQVRPEIERDLDLSPLTWRDRAVAEPLPPTARIAAIKITEVETKRVLFEANFDATGKVQPEPTNPAALKVLIAALRAPRAKEFVPGGFTERVLAAGAEQPWRLLLETTVALPGADGTELASTKALQLTERLGGGLQFAGAKDLDMVFSLEQPLVDALWTLTYGPRDPGPRVEQKK